MTETVERILMKEGKNGLIIMKAVYGVLLRDDEEVRYSNIFCVARPCRSWIHFVHVLSLWLINAVVGQLSAIFL